MKVTSIGPWAVVTLTKRRFPSRCLRTTWPSICSLGPMTAFGKYGAFRAGPLFARPTPTAIPTRKVQMRISHPLTAGSPCCAADGGIVRNVTYPQISRGVPLEESHPLSLRPWAAPLPRALASGRHSGRRLLRPACQQLLHLALPHLPQAHQGRPVLARGCRVPGLPVRHRRRAHPYEPSHSHLTEPEAPPETVNQPGREPGRLRLLLRHRRHRRGGFYDALPARGSPTQGRQRALQHRHSPAV